MPILVFPRFLVKKLLHGGMVGIFAPPALAVKLVGQIVRVK